MMEAIRTERLKVEPDRMDSTLPRGSIARAAEILRAGGTVAFPTETVYGLGANALSETAVEKIFIAKERPKWDPLIVHVADEAMLRDVVAEIPERARKLMDMFWPGPLTLLLPRTEAVPKRVTAGRERVGVRMPNHAAALALIASAGLPLAAPSANRFGRTSPTTAEHVLEDLDGRIDAVLDAGPTAVGVESTVLDVCDERMVLYRPGGISLEQLEAVAGKVELYRSDAETAGRGQPSPGVELRHYAPRARLVLVSGAELETELDRRVRAMLNDLESTGASVGVLLPEGWRVTMSDRLRRFDWGRWEEPETLAQRLFAGLRRLDSEGVAAIVCPVPPETGIGAAIRDRLQRAARRA